MRPALTQTASLKQLAPTAELFAVKFESAIIILLNKYWPAGAPEQFSRDAFFRGDSGTCCSISYEKKWKR